MGVGGCQQKCMEDSRCHFFSYWWTGHMNWCRLHATCDNFLWQDHKISIFKLVEQAAALAAPIEHPTGCVDTHVQCPESQQPTVLNGDRLEIVAPGDAATDPEFEVMDVTTFFNEDGPQDGDDVTTFFNKDGDGRVNKAGENGPKYKCCCQSEAAMTDQGKQKEDGLACIIVDLNDAWNANECKGSTWKSSSSCSCHVPFNAAQNKMDLGDGWHSYRDRRIKNHQCIVSREHG